MNQLLQKYNVEVDPTDPTPPPLSSSLSLFSRLQLELTRTRTRWTRGILSTWMNNWNPSSDSVEEVCPLGARGPAYIALQMNVGRRIKPTLIAWFSLILKGGGARSVRPALIGYQGRAGAQGGRAGTQPSGPLGLPLVPVASGLF